MKTQDRQEIPFKAWVIDEAIKHGLTARGIQARVMRGKYPGLKLRKVNQRVMFVQSNHEMQTATLPS